MTRRLGTPLYAMAEVGSTMDAARELAERGAPEGACVVADRQTKGRGRSGRRWESPPGGLCVSLILRPSRPLDEWPSLSLVAGVAVAEAIHELVTLDVQIRWPNDLLVNGRKLAGMLVEASGSSAIIGIGLNVEAAPMGLGDAAVSIRDAAGSTPTRYQIAAAIFQRLEHRYAAWGRRGFSSIRAAWLARSGMIGETVCVSLSTEELEGQVIDVDERGRLVIRLDTGLQRSCDVGEVRVLRPMKSA